MYFWGNASGYGCLVPQWGHVNRSADLVHFHAGGGVPGRHPPSAGPQTQPAQCVVSQLQTVAGLRTASELQKMAELQTMPELQAVDELRTRSELRAALRERTAQLWEMRLGAALGEVLETGCGHHPLFGCIFAIPNPPSPVHRQPRLGSCQDERGEQEPTRNK